VTLVSVVSSAEGASVADAVVVVGTVVADTPVAAIAILVGAASVVAIVVVVEVTVMVVVAIGMDTGVVAGLVVHTMVVMGAIGVAGLVDCSWYLSSLHKRTIQRNAYKRTHQVSRKHQGLRRVKWLWIG